MNAPLLDDEGRPARWIRAVPDGNDVPDRPPVVAPPSADPWDRVLLQTDGTVTTLLESCCGEPIATRVLRQSGPAPLGELRDLVGRWWHTDEAVLDVDDREHLVARQVTLSGARSGVTHVAAEAIVVADRLPELIARRLARPGASLGRLLATCRLAARRELVDIAAAAAGELGDLLGVRAQAPLLRRTYTIAVDGRPVAAVTEWIVPGRLATAAAPRCTGRFVVDL